MKNKGISFLTIDWSNVPKTENTGTTGMAYWQAIEIEGCG